MPTVKNANALLEFLRNLTPQILLLSVAIVLGTRLDTTTLLLTWQGIENAWAFVALVLIFCVAFISNLIVFFDRIFEIPKEANSDIAKAVQMNPRLVRKLIAVGKALWRHDMWYLFRGLVALLVVLSGSGALLISATVGAVQVLRALGKV